MKKENCVVICNTKLTSTKLIRKTEGLAATTRLFGFQFNAFIDYHMLREMEKLEDGTIVSYAQNFIQRNPSFNTVFFLSVEKFLMLKQEISHYLNWFMLNKIDVHFLKEDMKLINKDFSISSEFQKFLNH